MVKKAKRVEQKTLCVVWANVDYILKIFSSHMETPLYRDVKHSCMFSKWFHKDETEYYKLLFNSFIGLGL